MNLVLKQKLFFLFQKQKGLRSINIILALHLKICGRICHFLITLSINLKKIIVVGSL